MRVVKLVVEEVVRARAVVVLGPAMGEEAPVSSLRWVLVERLESERRNTYPSSSLTFVDRLPRPFTALFTSPSSDVMPAVALLDRALPGVCLGP